MFIDFKTGKRLEVSSIEKITQRLMKILHLQTSISPHKWRHTFATRFLSQGCNLEVLRAILGHHNLRITQKYLHLNPRQLREEYLRIMKTPSPSSYEEDGVKVGFLKEE